MPPPFLLMMAALSVHAVMVVRHDLRRGAVRGRGWSCDRATRLRLFRAMTGFNLLATGLFVVSTIVGTAQWLLPG